MTADLMKMVQEFQAKFDLPKAKFKSHFLGERQEMMYEEIVEYSKACYENNPEGALDALVDLVYFAIGTATSLDWDFNEAFRRVHAANMKKVRAHTERSAVDLIKPPGWTTADLHDLV